MTATASDTLLTVIYLAALVAIVAVCLLVRRLAPDDPPAEPAADLAAARWHDHAEGD